MKISIAGLGSIVLACVAWGQDAKAPLAFEVASVKVSAPPEGGMRRRVGCTGGPGTPDPGLLTCSNATATILVSLAYDLKRYQFSGPDWMNSVYFDITAKIPPGASKEQFRQMLQNLLAERFKLAIHHESKEMQTYELTVGKNGSKLKESAPPKAGEAAEPPAPNGPPRIKFNDGVPVFPPNVSMMFMMNGRSFMQQIGETMERFANFLGSQLNRPVTDATGLKGKYDIVLSWEPEGTHAPPPPEGGGAVNLAEPDPLPTLPQAIQTLGLRLDSKKANVDIVLVDRMEKTPVEN